MPLEPVTFRAVHEATPGPIWAELFRERWPVYRGWFLQEGDAARVSHVAGQRMIETHMPELASVYRHLCELAGGGDVASRLLSLVQPPPYLAACSQGVWTRDGGAALVRNYDYRADRLDGLIWSTHWTGRRVIGMGDCLWGLLDGMNDAGLAMSLTFGGRRVLGRGFGIALVVRYVLETCSSVAQATATLARLPYHLAHNVTLVDAGGEVVTAYLAPDRRPVFRATPVATNHQDVQDWPEYTTATRSHERGSLIARLLEDPAMTRDGFASAFLAPPLRDTAGPGHFGTLYTASFLPQERRIEYRWPGFTWPQSFDAFEPGEHVELLESPPDPSPPAHGSP